MILETSSDNNICCGEEIKSQNWKSEDGHSLVIGICPKCKSLFLNKINMIDPTTLDDTVSTTDENVVVETVTHEVTEEEIKDNNLDDELKPGDEIEIPLEEKKTKMV